MVTKKRNLYIAWVPFQRRAQSLASAFNLVPCYYHFRWGERNRLFSFLSWFGKGLATFIDLVKYRPDHVFIQLAPTPLLYITAIYCAITRCRYISDCHNTMLYDAHNIHWPLAKYLLRKSCVMIVHNEDVQAHAKRLGLPSVILRDPLPAMEVPVGVNEVAGIRLNEEAYVIVPGSMAVDEPLVELFNAAKAVPEALFVLTWFAERLPQELRLQAPANIRFTGFLKEPDFNVLYAKANAALVLTTREGTQPSGASEAISLGVPLIVSDIKTTRRLYKNHPIYVKNEPASITDGVRLALSNHEKWSGLISELKNELSTQANIQIEKVKTCLPCVST